VVRNDQSQKQIELHEPFEKASEKIIWQLASSPFAQANSVLSAQSL
jgi:hypothetical protein